MEKMQKFETIDDDEANNSTASNSPEQSMIIDNE